VSVIDTRTGAFIDGFRIVRTVGLTVENASPVEEAAWWQYVLDTTDIPREYALSDWTEDHWAEWVEERLAYHAAWLGHERMNAGSES
jgi:hypothetical protein